MDRPQDKPVHKIVLVGGSLTGNRGAEAMLRSAVRHLPDACGPSNFVLLSLYPRDDRAANDIAGLEIVPFPPPQIVLGVFPLAVLAGLLRGLGLPYRFALCLPALRTLSRADVMVDLSGISFVDGRGPILLYNVLMVAIPRLLGTPIVKYAQALGPFKGPLNGRLARWLLPKVARIGARGAITAGHLATLRLRADTVVDCADAAFALTVPEAERSRVQAFLQARGSARPLVGVSASAVVARLCSRRGVPYVAHLAAFIRSLMTQGYDVCLIAHAARPADDRSKSNDLPVCRAVAAAVGDPGCYLPDIELGCEGLRALIGSCRLLVASRFHAMIAGLAEGVPTMQVGWSHKYTEVLDMFDLSRYTVDYAALGADTLGEMFAQLCEHESEIRARLQQRLPDVIEASLRNPQMVAAVLQARHA